MPNHMLLKLHLIKDFHEVPAAGHPGVMARALIPGRPSTPILDLARYASGILGSRPATDFALEPSLWQPGSPSLVRVRVHLYIT